MSSRPESEPEAPGLGEPEAGAEAVRAGVHLAAPPPRPRPVRPPAFAPRSHGVQVGFGLAALAVALATLFLVRDEAGAFVLGGVLAFVIAPAVNRLERLMPRAVAVALTLVALLAVLAMAVSALAPLVTEEVAQLQTQGPALAGAAQVQLSRLQGHPLTVLGLKVNLSGLTANLAGHANDVLLGQFGNALGLGIAALGTLLQLLLMLVVAFLVALDAGRITRLVRGLTPVAYRSDFDAIWAATRSMLYAYIRGQLIVAALIGTLSGLAVWVIGVKFALALGLIAGVAALVPYLGPFLGAVPAVLVALASGPQEAIAVAIAYAVISNVVLNLVFPKIVGDAVRLPPLIVIVSFIAGFSLAGILGMFVAVPVAATIRILGDHLRPRVYGGAGEAKRREPA